MQEKMLTLKQYEARHKANCRADGCDMRLYDEIYPAGYFKVDWMEYTEEQMRRGYKFESTLEVVTYLKTFGKYWKETRRRMQHEFSNSVNGEMWASVAHMEEKGTLT